MVKLRNFCLPVIFSLPVRTLLQNAPVVCLAYTPNEVVCDKKVPFVGLINEKKFSGGIPLPPTFQRAVCMQIEKVG
jgi:hypothetical protein